jgi:hypothetical protein
MISAKLNRFDSLVIDFIVKVNYSISLFVLN